MYRVFEALDELGAIVEEARGVPMTAGCVVPRGDVLELIDDIKDAIPGELDDAQDVLDARFAEPLPLESLASGLGVSERRIEEFRGLRPSRVGLGVVRSGLPRAHVLLVSPSDGDVPRSIREPPRREEPGQDRRRAQPSLPGLRTRGRQPKKSRRAAGVIQANSARKAGMSVSRKMIAVWDGSYAR